MKKDIWIDNQIAHMCHPTILAGTLHKQGAPLAIATDIAALLSLFDNFAIPDHPPFTPSLLPLIPQHESGNETVLKIPPQVITKVKQYKDLLLE